MKKINCILLFLLLFTNLTFAQQLATGSLSEVKTDGLHEIIVPNEIRSFSNRDLSDFRIFDSNQNEVPYFIRQKDQSITTNEFVEYEIVDKNSIKDSVTVLVVENPNKTINQLVVQIANYAGSKTYRLLGSDDRQEWFGLVNNMNLNNLQHPRETSIFKTIDFPICSYKYLKIIFNDKNSLPINILKIGGSKSQITNATLQIVNFTSKDISEVADEKTTRIHFVFKNNEIINQLHFKITDPELYNRKATLYKIETKEVKGKKQNYRQLLASFNLNSSSSNSFNIPEIFEDDFFIEIENNDNVPLDFSEILFFQEPIYIITPLKADEKYTVKTGNKNLKTPKYDLDYFKNNISGNLPKATITDIKLGLLKQKSSEIDVFWKKPWFMWLCIVLAGIVVLYFVSSLVRDMKKGK